MELWFVYALLAAVASGLHGFLYKMIAQKKFDPDTIVMHSYFWISILSFILLVFNFPDDVFDRILSTFVIALLAESIFYFCLQIRIKSLRYIDTSIFFPAYKTVGPMLVLISGYVLFQENLSDRELLGVFLGIITSLFLISKSERDDQQILKGLRLMFFSTVLGVIAYIFFKLVIELQLNSYLFVFISSIIGLSVGLFQGNKKKKLSLPKFTENKGFYVVGLLSGIVGFSVKLFGLLALVGNMAVVYTIASFSILITIILSVIFYKEKMNLRRFISIILSILVLLLFI